MLYIRYIGGAVMFLASAYIGFSAAAAVRGSLNILRQLAHTLELMRCEISYAKTPAGRIFEILSASSDGALRRFYECIRERLPAISGNKTACETQVHELLPVLPPEVSLAMSELLCSFGRFGEEEQLRLIDVASAQISDAIDAISAEKTQRCRCYQSLGICTGLAVAVLVL